MTIVMAIVENRFKCVAGKALKFQIGPREESAALRGLPCYREENVELRVDVIPDLIDFDAVRVGMSQITRDMTRLFWQTIGCKLMIQAAAGDSALVRGHTDDRAVLAILIHRFRRVDDIVQLFATHASGEEKFQPLAMPILREARRLAAGANHPLDRPDLVVEDRMPRMRAASDIVSSFGTIFRPLLDRIEAGQLHGDERHLFERYTRAAFSDFAVIVRGHDLPVARVTLFTDRVEAAHELGGVFRIA